MRSHTSMSWRLIAGSVCRCGRVVQSLLQSVAVGAQHVQHAAVHHSLETPLVEVLLRLLFRFHDFDGWLTVPVLCGPVLFPTIIGFLTAGFGAVPLRPPVAGRPEFLAAEFALHGVHLRFPTFRRFPCFRRLNSGGNIGTAPEVAAGWHTRGPRPGIGSDAERSERHRTWFDGLLAGQQRSCMFVCLVALEPVADAVREPAVREAVWITAA